MSGAVAFGLFLGIAATVPDSYMVCLFLLLFVFYSWDIL
jgi:hypothetical protein